MFKRIAFFGAFLILSVAAHAQYVGQQSIGINIGAPHGPKGLSYYFVMTHHSALELTLGFDKPFTEDDQSADAGKGFFEKGAALFGIGYQPFLHAGDRDNGTNFFLNMGMRVRVHLDRPFAFNEDGMFITPDLYAGVGMQVELFSALEAYINCNLLYYNPRKGTLTEVNDFKVALDLNGGLRYRLFR